MCSPRAGVVEAPRPRDGSGALPPLPARLRDVRATARRRRLVRDLDRGLRVIVLPVPVPCALARALVVAVADPGHWCGHCDGYADDSAPSTSVRPGLLQVPAAARAPSTFAFVVSGALAEREPGRPDPTPALVAVDADPSSAPRGAGGAVVRVSLGRLTYRALWGLVGERSPDRCRLRAGDWHDVERPRDPDGPRRRVVAVGGGLGRPPPAVGARRRPAAPLRRRPCRAESLNDVARPHTTLQDARLRRRTAPPDLAGAHPRDRVGTPGDDADPRGPVRRAPARARGRSDTERRAGARVETPAGGHAPHRDRLG